MLRAIIASFFCLVLLPSCRKPLAQFQKSSYDNFETAPNNFKTATKIEKKVTLTKLITVKPTELFIDLYNDSTDRVDIGIKLNHTSAYKQPIKAYLSKIQKIENTKKAVAVEKKKKKILLFNDNIKIGAIFLGIAIGLSFFGLTQLTLIFGIASLVFIYLGLKKYYRRKRVRNLFNKKK